MKFRPAGLAAIAALAIPAVWYGLYSAGLFDDRSIVWLLGATLLGTLALRRWLQAPAAALLAAWMVASFLAFDAHRATWFDGPLEQHVVVEGDAAYLLEPITRATPAQLRMTLDTHPAIRRVELGSEGGNAMAGVQLARLIHARGLVAETAPDFLCQSACTYAFAGGVQRVAARGCPLRFHAEGGALPVIAGVMTRIHHALLDLPPRLRAEIRATPSRGPLLRIDSTLLRDRDGYVTRIDPSRPVMACRD
jgi:hypothetical protein